MLIHIIASLCYWNIVNDTARTRSVGNLRLKKYFFDFFRCVNQFVIVGYTGYPWDYLLLGAVQDGYGNNDL